MAQAAPNLLDRNFQVERPNMAWVSDITYISTLEGWLYLVAVADLYSGKIVGWVMDKQMAQNLMIGALKQTVGRVRPPRCILHSDRGYSVCLQKLSKLTGQARIRPKHESER